MFTWYELTASTVMLWLISSSSSSLKSENPSLIAQNEPAVFDVTSSNFHKMVLNSDVPVLLDVYADWCGPCKQIGLYYHSNATTM